MKVTVSIGPGQHHQALLDVLIAAPRNPRNPVLAGVPRRNLDLRRPPDGRTAPGICPSAMANLGPLASDPLGPPF